MFNIGDKVRVCNSYSKNYDKVGTIIDYECHLGNHYYFVSVDKASYPIYSENLGEVTQAWFAYDWLEFINVVSLDYYKAFNKKAKATNKALPSSKKLTKEDMSKERTKNNLSVIKSYRLKKPT